MQISVTGLTGAGGAALLESAGNRLKQALSRFSSRVSAVDVSLRDVNGHRGGVDKHCRIRVTMPGFEPVVAMATSGNYPAAISRAAVRARRVVLTRLKRIRARRERSRRKSRYSDPRPELQLL